jgi:hypothetical protein
MAYEFAAACLLKLGRVTEANEHVEKGYALLMFK